MCKVVPSIHERGEMLEPKFLPLSSCSVLILSTFELVVEKEGFSLTS